MKEERYFYVPDAGQCGELPDGEAVHALRVLRLQEGDEMVLMDGEGAFYRAEVSQASNKHCGYFIKEKLPQAPLWHGHIHLAVAPTKVIDRTEWLTEKATEVGLDELTFLACRFSERRNIRVDRMEKIAVAAMKQSRKPWKPQVNGLTAFDDFIKAPRAGRKFIAHCYDEVSREDYFSLLRQPVDNVDDNNVTILIGPEGDFSIDEVRMAQRNGYQSVSLGNSRLRTETAALVSVVMAQVAKHLTE